MSSQKLRAHPRFADLPVRAGAPPGSSWGVWGERDELGTLNFIGPEEVRAAAGLVRTGQVFPLNWDLTLPAPPFFGREPVRHTIIEKYGGVAVDDYLDSFWPQASSQWDGLRHYSDADHGIYDGVAASDATAPGPGRLGIEHWARRGIAGRGVLLDVLRSLERDGIEPDPFDFYPIGPELLLRVASEQTVELRRGDVLVLRTGWVEAYERLPAEQAAALPAEGRPGSPGLYGDDVPAFLWDTGIAAIAADNPGLEAGRRGAGSDLALHKALIARLGMPLGELWDVQRLAAHCATTGVYEFLLTSAPLTIPGGAGSPPNVLALT